MKPLALLPVGCSTRVARNAPAASSSNDTPRPPNDAPATRFANEPKPASAKRLPTPPRSNVAAQQVGRADRAVEHGEARGRGGRRRGRACRSRACRCCRLWVSVPAPLLVSDASREVVDLAVQARPSRCRARGRRARRRGSRMSRSRCRRRRRRSPCSGRRAGCSRSVAPAARPVSVPLVVNPAGAPPSDACKVSFNAEAPARVGHRHGAIGDDVAAVDDAEVDDRRVHLRRPPACRRGRSGRRSGPATRASGAPVVPAPLDTKFTAAPCRRSCRRRRCSRHAERVARCAGREAGDRSRSREAGADRAEARVEPFGERVGRHVRDAERGRRRGVADARGERRATAARAPGSRGDTPRRSPPPSAARAASRRARSFRCRRRRA